MDAPPVICGLVHITPLTAEQSVLRPTVYVLCQIIRPYLLQDGALLRLEDSFQRQVHEAVRNSFSSHFHGFSILTQGLFATT